MSEVKRYHVTVEEVGRTVFAVDARSEEEARERYYQGCNVEIDHWMEDGDVIGIEETDEAPHADADEFEDKEVNQ